MHGKGAFGNGFGSILITEMKEKGIEQGKSMQIQYQKQVSRWGVQEIVVSGKSEGNPFTDYEISAVFVCGSERKKVAGFYDGDGRYLVRFMPSFEETYTFEIKGTALEDGAALSGSFEVTAPEEGNHGPVHVANTYHFAYADGTPYYSIGTTCYVWELQSDELIEKTLDSLAKSPFNKIRFCIFPKHYDYNLGEPRSYPYEGTPMDSSVLTTENFNEYTGKTEGNHFDFYRFRPDHFRHIEHCIERLGKMGIEADLIVMHPYDRWGFSQMTPDQDDLYWKYVVARFSAYHNVWWAFANEYDIMSGKSIADWERYADLVCRMDPYQHLRSIHNCRPFYDHTRPWITHCSIQRQDLYKTAECTNEWRERYRKPVVLDEIAYEGNIQHGWGNISAEEMVRRFWEAACRGGYAGHGETYLSPDRILWWSHGGVLHGESWKRLGFLHDILCETPGLGLRPYENSAWDEVAAVPEDTGMSFRQVQDYYLIYYSFMCPSFREYHFDDTTEFELRILDTWNMTVTDAGIVKGKFRVELPGRPYMAIQLKRHVGNKI